MKYENYDLVQKNKNIIAAKLNPAFYQLLKDDNTHWFYENFINVVSYDKHGQHIIDFLDNNTSMYESKIQTLHIYSIDEVPCNIFQNLIVTAITNKQFINIWCDEYYIPQSIHFGIEHYVHPLTIYSIKDKSICCEFFSITHGMSLIQIPMEDIQKAFYSIKENDFTGASRSILQTAMQIYKVKEYPPRCFDITYLIQELSDYLHGQANSYKRKEYNIEGNNITYGMCYYNDLLFILKDENRYKMLPYKSLFDLRLHKLFLIERLSYVQRFIGIEGELTTYIAALKEIANIYELINKSNIKFNMKDNTPLFSISPNAIFRENLINYVEKAFAIELEVIPKIVAYLTKISKQNFQSDLNNFILELSGNDSILYPKFDDYLTQISIAIDKVADIQKPVKMQLSNGYVYNLYNDGMSNTYTIRPSKLTWIRISNCKTIKSISCIKLDDQTPPQISLGSWENWVPVNHIENWDYNEISANFNITGIDPYLVCHGLKLDTNKYKYITIEYNVEDFSNQAQVYFLTDCSPLYSCDKCLTFYLVASNQKFKYKLDLSNLQSWNNLVTLLRLDPVNYSQSRDLENIHLKCSLYDLYVSQYPPLYINLEDYAGNQYVNQWEYSENVFGKWCHMSFNPNDGVWGHTHNAHIGMNFQKGIYGNAVSRNWISLSEGIYKITLIADQDINSDISLVLDEKTIYHASEPAHIHIEDTLHFRYLSVLQLITWNGVLKNIYIEIQKI